MKILLYVIVMSYCAVGNLAIKGMENSRISALLKEKINSVEDLVVRKIEKNNDGTKAYCYFLTSKKKDELLELYFSYEKNREGKSWYGKFTYAVGPQETITFHNFVFKNDKIAKMGYKYLKAKYEMQ